MIVADLLEQLVTGLIMPSSLLQVVNNLFQTCYNKLGTSRANTTCWQLVNRLVTTCLQTCNNLCVFTRVSDLFDHFPPYFAWNWFQYTNIYLLPAQCASHLSIFQFHHCFFIQEVKFQILQAVHVYGLRRTHIFIHWLASSLLSLLTKHSFPIIINLKYWAQVLMGTFIFSA